MLWVLVCCPFPVVEFPSSLAAYLEETMHKSSDQYVKLDDTFVGCNIEHVALCCINCLFYTEVKNVDNFVHFTLSVSFGRDTITS